MILEPTRRAIAHYQPSDPRELDFRARMLALLEAEAAWSRHSFSPGHLTASAFVLSPERDALLLILHRKLKIWIQPGGHVEASDVDLEAAAEREVAEEVGLKLSAGGGIFDLDIHAIPPYGTSPAHEHFDVRYCFQAPTRDFVANDEVVEARWAQLDKIDQLTSDESVLRAARKLLRAGARAL